jgi:glucose/arabinose dehydrogenase
LPRLDSNSVVRPKLQSKVLTGRLPFFSVAVLLAVVLLLSAGCGGSGVEQGSSDEPSEPAGEGGQTELTESGVPPAEDTGNPDPESTTANAGPVQVETSVVATGLEAPWDLVFTPEGEALVTERDSGRLLSVGASGNVEELQTLPAGGVGEGGLLGLALSPDYERDGLIYAYYSTDTDNRVVRFREGEEPEPVLTGIPVNSFHNGGRIAFGPDGNLYVGTGDAGDRPSSQDTNSLAGKILRLTPEGGVPGDNPFPNNPLYSYGHRNVQGLAWDANGQLYASEFGQDTYDEVNRIVPRGNYGWPEVEGEGGGAGLVDPQLTWDPDDASPSGLAYADGHLWMAALQGEQLWRVEVDGDRARRPEGFFVGDYGRMRTIAVAPDGNLWVMTSNRDGRGEPTDQDDRILLVQP